MSPYRRKVWINATVAVLLALTAKGTAATIYSNLGPGDSFAPTSVGIGMTPAPVFTYAGVGFIPLGRSFVLSTIEIPVRLVSGPNELDVFLMGDAAGLPSGIIESFHVTNALRLGGSVLITLNSVRRPLLIAGMRYWVVAAGGSPFTYAGWNQNSINEMGPNVSGANLNALVLDPGTNVREAFRVSENRVTGISPNSVTAGAPQFTVAVNGSNFAPNMLVLWNGIPLATTYISSNQLTAIVPANLIARSGTVTIDVSGFGTATFTINPAPQPALTGLSQSSAVVGGPQFTLTITGAGFVPWSRVRWNGTELSTAFLSVTQLAATVPANLIASAGVASITVANSAEAFSNALSFVVSCSYAISAGGAISPGGSATSAVIPAAGGTGSVNVAAGAGCSWTATSDAPWLTIPFGAAGAGNGTVIYAVAANGGLARTATLTIAGQIFTINQLAAQPSIPLQGNVVSAASFQPGLASGAWIAIFGTNLSTTTRSWAGSDFAGDRLPIHLDGVGVNINGKPAYVYYISPTQLDVLAPEDPAEGPVQVEVANILGRSNAVTVQKQGVAPAWFTLTAQSRRYVAAVFPDGTLVGKPDLFPNIAARPAKPGDAIALYATGLGPTDPAYPDGQIIRQAAKLKNEVSIRIGGVQANVDFAGIVGAGLYQINIQVPDLPDWDAILSVKVQGSEAQDQAYVTVQR